MNFGRKAKTSALALGLLGTAIGAGNVEAQQNDSYIPGLRLYLGGLVGEGRMQGVETGISAGPLGFIMYYNQSGDRQTKYVRVPLSNGREGIGTENEVDVSEFGASAELDFERVIPYLKKLPGMGCYGGGAGFGVQTSTTKVHEEERNSNNDILKSNDDSKSDNRIVKRFYLTLKTPFNDPLGCPNKSNSLGLRTVAGKGDRGWYAGMGLNIPVGDKE